MIPHQCKACVIGWPIAHSRSPMIHGYWLKELGIEGSYEKIAVEPAGLDDFLRRMPGEGFVGGNVTIPHKEAVAANCTRLTPAAERLGAVNTLWFEEGQLVGDTTDGQGFLGALDQEVPGWSQRRDQALVLGAGGAARAIVDALKQRGFCRVVVANRNLARAEAVASRLGCEAAALDALPAELPETDLLVNTTAAGMKGQPPLALDLGTLPAHAVVDDIVYTPLVTPLLERAAARDLRTVGGLGMLLHQAVPGFERWFGARPQVTPALRLLIETDISASP